MFIENYTAIPELVLTAFTSIFLLLVTLRSIHE